ncbi:MAG: hypothetical protein O2951_05995 [Bacteroidetes bacterium]|nr:hypothetical protein [Bacteroidota bacterium]
MIVFNGSSSTSRIFIGIPITIRKERILVIQTIVATSWHLQFWKPYRVSNYTRTHLQYYGAVVTCEGRVMIDDSFSRKKKVCISWIRTSYHV